jgi:hypothetical protein
MAAGPDRTENTASNSYSIVACYTAVTYQWLFLWLHSSCFEQIYHNIDRDKYQLIKPALINCNKKPTHAPSNDRMIVTIKLERYEMK